MKALGIIFIIVGILCGVGGFMNTQESGVERASRDYADSTREYRQSSEALDNLSRAIGGGGTGYDARGADREVTESSTSYSSYREERETRMKWFFIAAVGFGVLGLILTVAAPKKAAQ